MVDLNQIFNDVVNRRTEEILQSSEIQLIRQIKAQGNLQIAARDRQLQAIFSADSTAMQIAEVNKAVINYNLGLSIDKLRRDSNRGFSTQRAQGASTGFDVTSQSFLAKYNQAADTADREDLSQRTNAGFQLNKLNLELDAQRKGFQIQSTDVQSQKESDRLRNVAEQYSALTQFLSGQIFRSDYTLAGASNAVRDKVTKSILG